MQNHEKTGKRFLSGNSYWNQPIPEDAKVDHKSEQWIKILKQEPAGENFGISWKKWIVPVYELDKCFLLKNLSIKMSNMLPDLGLV